MKKILIAVVFVAITFAVAASAFSQTKVLFGFERDTEGWEIPDWAYEQDDYVGEDITSSKDVANEGASSLRLDVDFPGERWHGAIAEVMEYFDWTPYKAISCDVYMPKDGPRGIKVKVVLTVGDNWKWTEMSRAYKLVPGEWVKLSANIRPGSEDWKRTKPDNEFRADIRKVAIRLESSRPAYKGPIYVDNFKLVE